MDGSEARTSKESVWDTREKWVRDGDNRQKREDNAWDGDKKELGVEERRPLPKKCDVCEKR